MRAFAQCPACQREYQSPSRPSLSTPRPTAVSACGPRLWFRPDGSRVSRFETRLRWTRRSALLLEGGILASARPGRISPRGGRHQRGGSRPAPRSQTPGGEAARGDGADDLTERARAGRDRDTGGSACSGRRNGPLSCSVAGWQRPIAPAWRPGSIPSECILPYHAPALPAAGEGRPAAGDDQRQSQRGADCHRQRRGAEAAGGCSRRVPAS